MEKLIKIQEYWQIGCGLSATRKQYQRYTNNGKAAENQKDISNISSQDLVFALLPTVSHARSEIPISLRKHICTKIDVGGPYGL